MSGGVTLKGRERELASLQRVLDANGPRVAFVYGVAGIGKSALLNAFASGVRESGTQVWRIDCAAIDPTESSFRAALDALGSHPERTLMVGDRASHDGAAVGLGMPTLLVPTLTHPGQRRLDLVRNLVGP
jgi:Cdc6-like AAA superfamily ATPase